MLVSRRFLNSGVLCLHVFEKVMVAPALGQNRTLGGVYLLHRHHSVFLEDLSGKTPLHPDPAQVPETPSKMATPSRIVELSSLIASKTAILDEHITANNLDPLSFDADGPTERRYPPEIEAARGDVEEATLELHELVKHPRALGTDPPHKHAAKAVIAKFEIARLVPEKESIVSSERAEQVARLCVHARLI